MATAADPAPPSRSYYEAYTKKQKAGNRFQDAVFVERGALRVARDQNKPPLPHLPTERKAIDRDEYARFLEAQLAAAGALLARFEQREEQVQQSIDNAARTCAEAAAGARAEEAVRMERRIVDLEARLAASETNLRKAEERSASAEARVDDACALVRELSSGPRLRAAEDRASAACARVADVEKALHAALRSLGEKGLTNLLEEDEEESTPVSERLAAAEVAVEAAQATALGATALAERLSKRLEDAERTARELAENATSHEDATAAAVIEAVANLESTVNERLEALEARVNRPPPSPVARPDSPVIPNTPAAARAGELLKEQLGLSEDPPESIHSADASDGTTDEDDDDAMARAGRDLDDARAIAEAVADEAVLRAEFAEQEAALLRERAGVLVQKLRRDDEEEPPSYNEHTTHHGGEFVLAPPQSPARLDHASPVRRSAPSSPASSRRSVDEPPKPKTKKSPARKKVVVKAATPPRSKARSYAESPPPQLDDVDDPPPLPPHLRQYEASDILHAAGADVPEDAPARKSIKKKKKVVKKKVAKRPPHVETGAETAAERARRRVLASRRTGVTHRGPIGATWPDSVTHPHVVARVPSGAAWVPAMKVGTPRLRSASPAPTSAPGSGV